MGCGVWRSWSDEDGLWRMPAPEALKTKEQLREYLAGAELQEVLRQTLSTILKRDELPGTDSLVSEPARTLSVSQPLFPAVCVGGCVV